MIEEIGEILYTLLVGYIGALELCYVAKHIYHLSHESVYQESDESRLRGLEEIQDQFMKAVTESEENQVEGFQVMKDGVLYKDGYRVDSVEKPLQRKKREINSTQLPINDDTKNNQNALQNDDNTLGENLSMNLNKEVQEEKITPIKINENESQKTNLEMLQKQATTKSENEINESFDQEKYVDDTIAKNNEIISSTLQNERDVQNSEPKIEGRFNVTDLSVSEMQKFNDNIKSKTNENELSGVNVVSEIIKEKSSVESKLDDNNEININESSRLDKKNKENNNLDENIYFPKSSDNLHTADTLSISQKSETINVNESSNENYEHSRSFSPDLADSVKNSKLESKTELQNNIEIEQPEHSSVSQIPLDYPEFNKSIILDNFDSESSAEDEENSIASVIEKKIPMEEESEDYKIILTEEEKEKVINSKDDDVKFKDLSEILKRNEIVKDDIIETPLEEETYNENEIVINKQEQQNIEEFLNIYEDENTSGDNDSDTDSKKRLRRSPRMVEIDHYEERWTIEENEQRKRKQLNETEVFIENEKVSEFSEEVAEVEGASGKLILDITKTFISKEQNLTPSIELFDESGQKSPSIILSDEPSTQLTPTYSIMEGLSDFYDFNASINPSRSASRSPSVSPSSPEPHSKFSTPFTTNQSPESPGQSSSPKDIENLSDFYDFSVKLNQAAYPKRLSFKNEDNSEHLILKDLKNVNEPLRKVSSPCFNYSFNELKLLSEMSICASDETDKAPDSNFIRSNYIGASQDYSYDFEELREQTRNFIRSRSPSVSFDDHPISIEDYRKEIQNNILKELEEKSLNYDNSSLEVNKEYFERERRESDSALIKKTEIVFQIQDEPDFIQSHDKYNVFVENFEVEPEEYHHFRRFSWQQEYPVEQYPEDEYIYLDKETLNLMNDYQDNVIDLENISSNGDETKDIILKTIMQNTSDADKKIEDNAENSVIADILDEDNEDQTDLNYVPKKEYKWRKNFKLDDEEEFEHVDMNKQKPNEYIAAIDNKDGSSSEKEDIQDTSESHETNFTQNIEMQENKLRNKANNEGFEELQNHAGKTFDIIDVDEAKTFKEDLSEEAKRSHQDENNDFREEKFNVTEKNLNNGNMDHNHDSVEESFDIVHLNEAQNVNTENDENDLKKNNNDDHDIEEESFDIIDGEEDENEFDINNKNNYTANDGAQVPTDVNDIHENETQNFNIGHKIDLNNEENGLKHNEDFDFEEEGFNIIDANEAENFDIENRVDLSDIPDHEESHSSKEASFTVIYETEISNDDIVNNYSETIIDPDDGIDEEIYDYNERPDESYNQSECGENNNYDMEGYDESGNNEFLNNLYQYNATEQDDRSQDNNYNEENNNSNDLLENKTTPILDNTNLKEDSSSIRPIQNDILSSESTSKTENVNLDKQIDKMYDDSIKNRRKSRIERDYDGIVDKMNTNYDDDTASITTDEMIEQIYFKDLSPSRFERMGSEDSFCSNYSSLSQGSLSTRLKYKGISHARQIKSDRLRTRYGIAPAIGAFANFENTDDTPVSYVPRKEYNWRKNFKLDDDDDGDIEKNKRRKNYGNNENDKNEFEYDKPYKSENVEGILNDRIDTMYDEVVKNRRKSRIEKEFEKIAEEIEIKPEELNELDSVSTEKILKDILNSSSELSKATASKLEDMETEKLQESEKISKQNKSKKKIRKNSSISINNENSELIDGLKYMNETLESFTEKPKKKNRKNSTINFNYENSDLIEQPLDTNDNLEVIEKSKKKSRKNSSININNESLEFDQLLEGYENSETIDKPKKKKSSRKNSLLSATVGEENGESPIKTVKKIKKIKKRQSIDESQSQILDFDDKSNFTSSSNYEVSNSLVNSQKVDTPPNTPCESIIDDAEKFSNSSISNSSLSLISSQARLDRIGDNDILELIKESSILGSSF